MPSNRTSYTTLLALFLTLVYVLFPVPAYWTVEAGSYRIALIVYVIAASAAFWLIAGERLDDRKFGLSGMARPAMAALKRKEVVAFLAIILTVKAFTIYANPLWIVSDEMAHVHRGESLLLVAGNSTGIIHDTQTSQHMLMLLINRYPPLSMVAEGLSMALFGGLAAYPYLLMSGLPGLQGHFLLDEMAVRFPSLLFMILTFIVVYVMAGESYDRRTSFLAAATVMLLPSYFMWTSSAHLVSGVVFFTSLAVCLFAKYLKQEELGYLMLCALAVSMGALYKRQPVLLAAIIPAYILMFTKMKGKLKPVAAFLSVIALVAGPYYMMVQIFANYRPFGFDINLAGNLLAYILTFPIQMTLPLALIALVAIPLTWKRTALSRFSAFWIVTWVLFFSMDSSPVDRITAPLFVPLAILAADLMMSKSHALRRYARPDFVKNAVIVIVLAFLAAESLMVFSGLNDVRGKHEADIFGVGMDMFGSYSLRTNMFPYREASGFLVERLDEGEKVAILDPDGNAFWDQGSILEFYLRNTDGSQFRQVVGFSPEEASSGPRLYRNLESEGINYLVIPDIDAGYYGSLLPETYTQADLGDLLMVQETVSSSGLFSREAGFYSGTNGLLVFRRI